MLAIFYVFHSSFSHNNELKTHAVLILGTDDAAGRHWGIPVEVQLHASTAALDGGMWSAARPGRFIGYVRAPGTHRREGLGAPPNSLSRRYEQKNLTLPEIDQ